MPGPDGRPAHRGRCEQVHQVVEDAEAVEAAVGLDEDLFAAQLWVDDEPMTMVWSLPTP
ncbi:hypothetical protein GCM10009827_120100 [Dactylosporangium maewongense]|uniref:Uncharacterized protein n=1 Tax=Dactylosporangium maewongense TaxID=634393 RepID=A0ABP4PFY3_9ACTN